MISKSHKQGEGKRLEVTIMNDLVWWVPKSSLPKEAKRSYSKKKTNKTPIDTVRIERLYLEILLYSLCELQETPALELKVILEFDRAVLFIWRSLRTQI